MMKIGSFLLFLSTCWTGALAAVRDPVVIGRVTQFYLMNAASERFVRVLEDGDTIDLSVDGTSLTICVDTTWEVSAVQMSIDSTDYPFQMLAPFCLGAMNLGPSDYESIPALTVLGQHTITGTPYKLNGVDGAPGTIESITINVIDGDVLPDPIVPEEVGSLGNWYLVNAASDTFIKYVQSQEVVDHAVVGNELNLCVDTTGDVGSVTMSINGRTVPHHNRPPFCLAADESTPGATFEAVDEFRGYGTFTVSGTPYFTDDLAGDAGITESITLTFVDSSAPSSAPSAAIAFEPVGTVSRWYLVNAETDEFIRYMANGGQIDLATDGNEFNLCVDTLGDVASVEMSINGRVQDGHHNIPPFCLAADEAGPPQTFESVPELSQLGQYSIVATPFGEDELQGEKGASSALSISVIDSSVPEGEEEVGEITGWYLVNAATDEFVRYIRAGEIIYQSVDGTELNLCVNTQGDVASVQMTLNGQVFPHHNIPPFCLGADEAGPPQTFDGVSELSSTGSFSLTATPYSQDDLAGPVGTSDTVSFRIRNAPGRMRARV